jgi:hypothetical protein
VVWAVIRRWWVRFAIGAIRGEDERPAECRISFAQGWRPGYRVPGDRD